MKSIFGMLKSGSVAALTLAFATSCYTTTVRSGKPAADATAEYDGKWHSGLVFGLAELSGPYDLSEICPNGWAEISTETSFVNGLVGAVTDSIYTPQTVTVRCARGAKPSATGAPAPEPNPVPPEEDSAPADEPAEGASD